MVFTIKIPSLFEKCGDGKREAEKYEKIALSAL
jgi:hypothetical protein